VIRVGSNDIETVHDVQFVDFAVRGAGEILGDELVRAFVLIDDFGLPSEEICCFPLRVALPLQFPAGIDDSVARGKFVPVVEPLAPIIQAPHLIQFVYGSEFGFQMFLKTGLDIRIGSTGRGSFIVDLVANDRRIVLVVFQNFPDDALAVKTIGRVH